MFSAIFQFLESDHLFSFILHLDIYPLVDSQLSDANVGSRKGRNIRDNLFALYAVINSIKSGNEEACDLGVYNVTKCFDALWNQECLNDLWDVGCQNDKLNVLAQGNISARVAVKTPEGTTKKSDHPKHNHARNSQCWPAMHRVPGQAGQDGVPGQAFGLPV